MHTHPFAPQITHFTRKLLIGTLPPEGVKFYFSNSSNTRLWDILGAIRNNNNVISTGGNKLSDAAKISILNDLSLGITDIIYEYTRDDMSSTRDSHIVPHSYNDLLKLTEGNDVSELLFVYQSAYKWFLHSLDKLPAVRLRKLKSRFEEGEQAEITHKGKVIKIILLPSPLNRGKKGHTLEFKLKFYKRHILD